MSISSSKSSVSSSMSSSESVSSDTDYDLFENINRLPQGIHVIYNPHAYSTHNKTSRYIPKSYKNFPIHLHNPRKTYKDYDSEELWGMACSSVKNTMHDVKENDEIYQVHTCDPAMDGDYFEFDKLDSTTNMILLYIKIEGETASPKMKSFVLCRDLHAQTLKKMRTKARQDEYGHNGDFIEYMAFEDEPCLYVDGLCSKQRAVGRLLMELLDKIVYDSPHYKAIKLAALSYVVKYYYKIGYRFSNSPKPTFQKNINDEELLSNVNTEVSNLPKIARDEEYNNPEWVNFISKMQK